MPEVARGNYQGSLQNGRIVIADPDDRLRQQLAWAFRERGFSVHPCSNGAELASALSQAVGEGGANSLDLVITDVLLPGTRGLSVLAALATSDIPCRLVLLRGSGDDDAQVEAMRLCSAAVFQKPLDPERFATEVEGLLK